MPNRIIREGILTSDRVDKLSEAAEVFYRRLMSVVDDFGRYYAKPVLLRAACYPTRIDCKTNQDICDYLIECGAAGLLEVYTINDQQYLELKEFRQRTRLMMSKFPSPDNHMTDKRPSNDRHSTAKRRREVETELELETETKTEVAVGDGDGKATAATAILDEISDKEWMQSLQVKYPNLNVYNIAWKCQRYCREKGVDFIRSRLENWLADEKPPVNLQFGTKKPGKRQAPDNWREIQKKLYPDSDANYAEFHLLPADIQKEIRDYRE